MSSMNLSARLVVLGLAAAGLLGAVLPRAVHAADARPPRIAVVDMQRAVLETEDGLRAQSTLRKFFERRQAELNIRQDELARKKDDIEKQAKVLSKDALQRALQDWQTQVSEFQNLSVQYDQERVKRQNEVTAPIYGRVAGLLRKLSQRDSYDLILDRQAVPYVKAELDLTDQLILMYNNNEEPTAAEPATSAPPAAPPASSAPPPAASSR